MSRVEAPEATQKAEQIIQETIAKLKEFGLSNQTIMKLMDEAVYPEKIKLDDKNTQVKAICDTYEELLSSDAYPDGFIPFSTIQDAVDEKYGPGIQVSALILYAQRVFSMSAFIFRDADSSGYCLKFDKVLLENAAKQNMGALILWDLLTEESS